MALKRIGPNTNLILPYLPNIHKHPFLIEWIYSRYNYTRSDNLKRRNLNENQRQWYLILNNRKYTMDVPISKDVLYQSSKLSWDFKKQLTRISRNLIEDFYRDFKFNQIEQARETWGTMEPFTIGIDKFRETFYSFLHNIEPDIYTTPLKIK